MNTSLLRILALAIGSVICAVARARAEEPPPLSVAVLDFTDGSEELAGTGASVAALLQARLSTESDSPLVERAELNEILSEHELTLSESVGPGQAAKVGQLTGAEVLISGRVFSVQDRVHLVAKVISSSTGRVFGAATDYERQGRIDDAVATLAEQLVKLLKDQRDELRGGRSLEERQVESLKGKMKDRRAPKVYVSVQEAVLRTTVPDPAVRTELCRTLEAGGWKVVEAERAADVLVTGEAFAETGIRRGALWFVRARLEFTVKSPDGKVLKTDRIVAGNVDLAEAVGCKGALQKLGLLAATPVADAWLATLE